MKKLTQVKIISCIIAMGLAFYPIFELTRYIIQYNLIAGWSRCPFNSYAELGFMWFFYLLMPFAVSFMVDLAHRMGRKGER